MDTQDHFFFHRLRREIIKRTRKEKQLTRKTLHVTTRSGQQASSSHHCRVASSGRPPLMPYTRGNGQIRADGIMGCTYVSTCMHTLTELSACQQLRRPNLQREACVFSFFFSFSGAVTEEGYESTGQALTRLIGIDFTSLSPILLLCLFLLLRRSGPVHLCPPPPPHIGQCVFLVTAFHQQRAGWGGARTGDVIMLRFLPS